MTDLRSWSPAVVLLLTALPACAGTLRFNLEVCHPVGAADETSCEAHGTIVSPFTRDQRSEEDALEVRLCASFGGYSVEVLDGARPTVLDREEAFSDGSGCEHGFRLQWGRDVAFTTYRVVVDPSGCDACAGPIQVEVSAAESPVSSFEIIADRRREAAILIVRPPRE